MKSAELLSNLTCISIETVTVKVLCVEVPVKVLKSHGKFARQPTKNRGSKARAMKRQYVFAKLHVACMHSIGIGISKPSVHKNWHLPKPLSQITLFPHQAAQNENICRDFVRHYRIQLNSL